MVRPLYRRGLGDNAAMARRILFATFGSLGDLHPYLALASELARRGHVPSIATTDRFADVVRAQGIGFVPMHPLQAQLGAPEPHVERVFDPKSGPEYLIRRLVMPHVRQAYNDLAAAAQEADVLVTHPLAVAGRLVAEKTGLPWISTVLSPLSLFSAIDAPVLPGAPLLSRVRKLGVLPYRALFRLAAMRLRTWEQPLRELRSELGASQGSAGAAGRPVLTGTQPGALFSAVRLAAARLADQHGGVRLSRLRRRCARRSNAHGAG